MITQKIPGFQTTPDGFPSLLHVPLWLSAGSAPRCPHLGTRNIPCACGRAEGTWRVTHTHRCATLAVTQVTSSHNKWGRSHVAIPEPKTPHQSLPSFPGRRGRGKIWWTIILTPTMALEDHFYMFPICSYKHLLLNLKFDRRATDWKTSLSRL